MSGLQYTASVISCRRSLRLGTFRQARNSTGAKRPHQTARPSVVRIAPRANFPPKAELTIIWFDPASVAGKDTFDETRKPWKQDEQK